MFQRGYWTIGRFRGAQIKAHWSILLGAFVFAHFRLSPGFFLAFPCLILVHELGHAYLAARLGHEVIGIEATGLGGECQWSGNASPFEEALIAWGGVLAQLLLFVATQLWLWLLPEPTTAFGWEVANAFTHTNLYLIAVNLLPIPPLDGARAWSLFAAWKDRGPKNLPYGTWRDHSANAQRAWFDQLRGKGKPRKSTREDVRVGVKDEAWVEEGPLDAKSQAAIDQLLRKVTGIGRGPKDRDPER